MSHFHAAFLLLLVISPGIQAQKFAISTVAGNTAIGTTPVESVKATIGNPLAIAADANGNVYFSSYIGSQNFVFKIDGRGMLSRVAVAFDGSAAGLSVDSAGNLYIADVNHHRIQKMSPSGAIMTVAGNGIPGSSGDGGPATSAAIMSPSLLAVDSAGNLFVAENNGSRIRKISGEGIITTIAGEVSNGDGEIGSVRGLSVDRSGNLYFSDNFHSSVEIDGEDYPIIRLRVRRISPDGTVTTIAGNGSQGYSGDEGPAIGAQLSSPGALAGGRNGTLYIADGPRIRRVSPDGIITTIAGDGTNRYVPDNGPALFAGFVFPTGLATDSADNLYVADAFERIRKVSSDGIIATIAGTGASVVGLTHAPGDGGAATLAPLTSPVGVAVDSAGALYIADTGISRIRRVSPEGIISTIAGKGAAGPAGDGGPATDAYVSWPTGLAIDGADNLYVVAAQENRIRMISPAGIITTVAGLAAMPQPGYSGDGGPATSARLNWPRDICLDGTGNIYIADTGNHRIRKISPDGNIATVAGIGSAGYLGDEGPAVSATLNLPSGLALDSAGNLYISDTNNFRVRRISAGGIITTIAGTGVRGYSGDGGLASDAQLNFPLGLKVDGVGNLYIADGGSVRMVSPAGIITTIAGNGVTGNSGDGGPAAGAQLGAWGLTLDRNGNLYVADPWNNTIRLLTR